jgi:catechol 2,3-dioxygenase-like lactoylglutathione lyase family enzyme
MTVRKLQTIVLYVADVAAAADFYGGALGLPKVYESGTVVALAVGDTRLLLHPADGPRALAKPYADLYLEVDDLEGTLAELVERGARISREPRRQPWGEVDAGVLDPDGFEVNLTQPQPDSWTGSPAG